MERGERGTGGRKAGTGGREGEIRAHGGWFSSAEI